MAQITATITNIAPTARENVNQITVTFDDGKGKWTKNYTLSNTNEVKLDRVKQVIKADLKNDLKPKVDTMAEIKKALNKPITFTI